jgi:hypothetical protein
MEFYISLAAEEKLIGYCICADHDSSIYCMINVHADHLTYLTSSIRAAFMVYYEVITWSLAAILILVVR